MKSHRAGTLPIGRAVVQALPPPSPADTRLFRELVARAPSDAWIAVARKLATPASCSESAAQKFELLLVKPSERRVEQLYTVRRQPKCWSDLDTVVRYVEETLQAATARESVPVHVI